MNTGLPPGFVLAIYYLEQALLSAKEAKLQAIRAQENANFCGAMVKIYGRKR